MSGSEHSPLNQKDFGQLVALRNRPNCPTKRE